MSERDAVEGSRARGFGTRSVHAGEVRDPDTGSVVTPLYRTSTFRFPDESERKGPRHAFYPRYGHPNFETVERKFSALHGSDDACLFGSGMAAFSGILLALVRAGDAIVAVRD